MSKGQDILWRVKCALRYVVFAPVRVYQLLLHNHFGVEEASSSDPYGFNKTCYFCGLNMGPADQVRALFSEGESVNTVLVATEDDRLYRVDQSTGIMTEVLPKVDPS